MPLHVLIATAEFDPLVKVGGLGEATSGLAAALCDLGVQVTIVVPDYPVDFAHDATWQIDIADWAGGVATVRSAHRPGIGDIHAIAVEGIRRPGPYVDPATGQGWADNDRRFAHFSSAVAAMAQRIGPDVVHLNDWHTAMAAAWLPPHRCVLGVHNLAHQGWCDIGWLAVLGDQAAAFAHHGACNPLAGAVRLCSRVVAVSPGHAAEIVRPGGGFGLERDLAQRGGHVVGIRNGIDMARWNPAVDPLLPVNFSPTDLSGKELCRKELLHEVGLDHDAGPVIAVVSRFVHQKGIDIVCDLLPFLAGAPASLVMHGSGDPALIGAAEHAAAGWPDDVRFVAGYDESFAHLLVAGSDLLLMPSRFEPCGLTQMQAMACGTLPIVTAVGGLADTVVDTDRNPGRGTGFVAPHPDTASVVDAVHRAVRGWRNPRRRQAMQRRAMNHDWSWRVPAEQYLDIYRAVHAGVGVRSIDRACL